MYLMADEQQYKAKTHYQQSQVARDYDEERFSSWHGRKAHQMEARVMRYALEGYFEPGGTVLDLPCGTGRLFEEYLRGGFQVTGADVSEEMLSVARARMAVNTNFSFRLCDAENLPFSDNTFDYLVSFRLMCHLPEQNRRKVLAEMSRVTRKVLAVNYHFDVNSPLMLVNKLLSRKSCLPYPLRENDLDEDVRGADLDICEVQKLSWYERSSTLVIMRQASLGSQIK